MAGIQKVLLVLGFFLSSSVFAQVPAGGGGGSGGGGAVSSVNAQTGAVVLDSDDIAEGVTNLYFTTSRAKNACVADSISNGITDVAPSQNAVFDALASKQDAGVSWLLSGNSGTSGGTDFVGTTDAQGLFFKTDSTQRLDISSVGKFNFEPLEMQITGNVGAVSGSYNQLFVGQNFQNAITGQYYGPYLSPTFNDVVSGGFYGLTLADFWNSGSQATSYSGLSVNPNIQSGATIGNMQLIAASPNIPAGTLTGSQFSGINVTPNIQSNFSGYNGINNQPAISTTVGGYIGLSEGAQFQSGADLTIYKGIQVQPSVQSGAEVTSVVGIFSGVNINSGSIVNDFTGLQSTPDVDANINAYQNLFISQGGDGDITNMQDINISRTGTGDITNYTSINIAPSGSGTVTNMTGVKSDVSGITSPNQKVAGQFAGGSLVANSPYDTSSLDPSPVFGQLNAIGGTYTVAAGFPASNSAMVANNLASVAVFDDDMGADAINGNLGFTYVGFIGQLDVGSGVTVDTVNAAVAGMGVPAGSTGAVTNANMYAAFGTLNQGGTVSVTNMSAFHAHSTICDMSTNCWGLKVDSSTAANYVAGGFEARGVLKTGDEIQVEDPGAGTNKVTIQSPTLAGDYTLTLPTDDGSSGQVLQTNGSGVLSWASPASSINYSDWTTFSMSITATSNPTKGGGTTVDLAYWRRVGDTMEIRYEYRHTSAGSAGTGTYNFIFPNSETADSAKVTLGPAIGTSAVCDGRINNGSEYIPLHGEVNAAGTGVVLSLDTENNYVSATRLSLGSGTIHLSFRCAVPISGW